MKSNLINKITLLLALFSVFVVSGCKQAAENIYVTIDKRKSSDILVIMYMSGDANNGDNFLPSIQEAEDALTYIRNEDDTAKAGYKSVNVVALFDGASDINTSTKLSIEGVHSDPETRLLELGRGFHNLSEDGTNAGFYNSSTKTDWSFSSNTIDLSQTVDWIMSNGKQELNMSSYKTLTDFLTWVNNHYTGNEIILAFGDHGGGPGVELENTSNQWTSRAIIFDSDSNGDNNKYLRTCDVVYALNAAGLTGDSAPDVIIEDLCLGGSIEEIYGLKGSAHYFLGSPNKTWGNSMGYYHFITNLASDKSLETVCKEEVDNFASKWPAFSSSVGSSTFTYADLSATDALESVKNNVNLFAEKVMSDTTKHIKYDGSYVYLKDLGWLCESISKDYPEFTELGDYCKAIEDALSKVIIYSFGSKYYYTNHENGSYSVNDKDKKSISYRGMYAAGSWYGLSISVSQQNYIKDSNNVVIPYENCSLFGEGNKWGEILRFKEE